MNTKLCERCSNAGCELHTCPYQADINGDYSSLCNCCDDCCEQCALDI